jgi:hypothetical protein
MTLVSLNGEFYLNPNFFIIFEKVALIDKYSKNIVKELFKLIDDLKKEKNLKINLMSTIWLKYTYIILKYIEKYCPPSLENNSSINRKIIRLDKELRKIILYSDFYHFIYGDFDANTFSCYDISPTFKFFFIDKKQYYIYNYFKYLQLVLIKKNISNLLHHILPYLNLNNCDNLTLKFKKFNLITVQNTS